MQNWRGRSIILAILMMSGMMRMGAAQEVTDTLQITIEGDLAGVAFQSFEVSLRIGDTVTYVAQAVDSEGDPVTSGVVYTYASSDTTLLVIDAITGFATALRKGNVEVIVRAEYGGLEMRVASFRDGELTWGSGKITRYVDSLGNLIGPEPTLQFCAYVVDGEGFLVVQSEAPPTCPLAIPERPTAPAYPMFAGISRVRPDLFVFSGAG